MSARQKGIARPTRTVRHSARVEKLSRSDSEWRSRLSAEQFAVCRRKGTEPPFHGDYWNCEKDGVYLCVCCGQPLFDAKDKFDSGTGWPSFTKPAEERYLEERVDSSIGMTRTEVLCARCDAHLGHVFPDGPPPGGLRYCINSIALSLKPRAS